jgi:hypothetical protein
LLQVDPGWTNPARPLGQSIARGGQQTLQQKRWPGVGGHLAAIEVLQCNNGEQATLVRPFFENKRNAVFGETLAWLAMAHQLTPTKGREL